MSKFDGLLTRYAISSLLRQINMANFLKSSVVPPEEQTWGIDLDKDTSMDLGKAGKYPCQIIGTQSKIDGSWLWSWANAESDLPSDLLKCANFLRTGAEKEGIREFTAPQLSEEEYDAYALAAIASEVGKASAFYPAPSGDCIVYFNLYQVPLPAPGASDTQSILQAITQAISQFRIDHRAAIHYFFQQQGYSLQESAEKTTASGPDGKEFTVSFDAQGRVSDLKTTLTP